MKKRFSVAMIPIMVLVLVSSLLAACGERVPVIPLDRTDLTGLGITGVEDQVQLLIKGHSTQTSDAVQVQTSAGTELFTIDNSGNVDVSGAVNSAGAMSDDDSAVTVEDNVIIDGQADLIQLTVQGHSTQSTNPNLFVVENSVGNDLFTVDVNGDVVMSGTTPLLTIGDEGGEDTAIVFDGASQDYYIALEDGSDDLMIGLGATPDTTEIIVLDENQDVGLGAASAGSKLDVTGNAMIDGDTDEIQLLVQAHSTQNANVFEVETSAAGNLLTLSNAGALNALGNVDVDGTLNVDGNISDAGTAVTFADNVLVDGAADVVQLTAQGYATQTSHIFVVEETGATDLFWVTNDGDVEMNGTTPALTIGDAGEEDAQVNFDGAAIDFHVGIYDTGDTLVIGKGTAAGTTSALSIDTNLKTTTGGDVTVAGATPLLTIGDDGEEDVQITFDGHSGGQDFYAGIYDTSDDLQIGLGGTLNTTPIIVLDENEDMGLGAASAGAKLDVSGNVMIDGAADEIQLLVSGYTTQTSNIFVVEETGATDLFWITNNGDVEMNGATPALTIGDAGEEDTQVSFDGAEQDYHVGLRDSNNTLVLGLGVTLGTTPAVTIDASQDVALAKFTRFTEQSAQTVTDGGLITPTGTYHPISAGGSVTVTFETTGYTAGDLCIIVNEAAQDILVNDTGTTMLSAALTLQQYDSLTVIFDGTNWVQLATSDN